MRPFLVALTGAAAGATCFPESIGASERRNLVKDGKSFPVTWPMWDDGTWEIEGLYRLLGCADRSCAGSRRHDTHVMVDAYVDPDEWERVLEDPHAPVNVGSMGYPALGLRLSGRSIRKSLSLRNGGGGEFDPLGFAFGTGRAEAAVATLRSHRRGGEAPVALALAQQSLAQEFLRRSRDEAPLRLQLATALLALRQRAPHPLPRPRQPAVEGRDLKFLAPELFRLVAQLRIDAQTMNVLLEEQNRTAPGPGFGQANGTPEWIR
eukprot:Skav218517  [mRNA]  locus=scaffold2478:156300:162697:- [translate_table: standard]